MTKNLQEWSNELNKLDKDWWDRCFETQPGTPANLRRLAERLCRSYGIRGLCDPAYIANVIAVELGLGDGLGHFKGVQP